MVFPMTFSECIKNCCFSYDFAMASRTALTDGASKLLVFLLFFYECIEPMVFIGFCAIEKITARFHSWDHVTHLSLPPFVVEPCLADPLKNVCFPMVFLCLVIKTMVFYRIFCHAKLKRPDPIPGSHWSHLSLPPLLSNRVRPTS